MGDPYRYGPIVTQPHPPGRWWRLSLAWQVMRRRRLALMVWHAFHAAFARRYDHDFDARWHEARFADLWAEGIVDREAGACRAGRATEGEG